MFEFFMRQIKDTSSISNGGVEYIFVVVDMMIISNAVIIQEASQKFVIHMEALFEGDFHNLYCCYAKLKIIE